MEEGKLVKNLDKWNVVHINDPNTVLIPDPIIGSAVDGKVICERRVECDVPEDGIPLND